HQRGQNCCGPDRMSKRRGHATQSARKHPRGAEHNRCLHKTRDEIRRRRVKRRLSAFCLLLFLLFSISGASRSNSSGDTCEALSPSKAVTVFSAEPSKNVSTRCRRADRRATSRGTVGT